MTGVSEASERRFVTAKAVSRNAAKAQRNLLPCSTDYHCSGRLFQLLANDPAQGAFQVVLTDRLFKGLVNESLIAAISSLSLEPGNYLGIKHDVDALLFASALSNRRLPLFLGCVFHADPEYSRLSFPQRF